MNQHGRRVPVLPKSPSIHGLVFRPNDKHLTEDCTMLEYATRHALLDVWTPYIRLQFSANHTLTYGGDKAVAINKEWNRRIFEKQKRK